MDPGSGQTRPLSDEEIVRLEKAMGRQLQLGDRHPETGEVIVSAEVAHAQQVGRSELSRRERRNQARAEKRRQSRLARGLTP